jgi:soluble lytic murein transglycosylase-like protein
MIGRTTLLTLLASTSVLMVRTATADIFVFTDEFGTTHYTNVPTDARYAFLLAAPQDRISAHARVDELVLRKAERYAQLIEGAARANSIEPALVRAVMVAESGCDPQALSRRGARGLMQLMPATARQYGVRNAFDPEQNIKAGSQYLRDLIQRYQNDLELVLAAYNAGPAAVDGHGGRIPPLKETLDYVPRVMEIYRHLQVGVGTR